MKIKRSLFCFWSMLLLASCSDVSDHSVIDLDPSEAADLIQDDSAVKVIDVRTPEEFASGSIKGALNLNIQSPTFISQVQKLDQQATYLVYCRSGNRSTQAIKTFQQEGFVNIYHLNGGVNAWRQAGLPLE